MQKTWLRRTWLRMRHSAWYPAIVAVLPNFIISLFWSYGATGGTMGFIANFVTIEGLVILILAIARPALQAKKLLEQEGFIEVTTPEAKILVGRIKAESPPSEFEEDWNEAFPKLKDAWAELLQESERALRVDAVTPRNLRMMIDTLASASVRIRLGRPLFDIDTIKQAACYLGHPAAQNVTRVLITNRIQPVLWFVPEMAIYFLDLFRHVKDHPVKVEFIRISIFEDEEWQRVHDPQWRILTDVDPLKAFVAINQMAGINLKGLTLGKFSETVERFMDANEARIQAIGGTYTNELKDFIRKAAFIVYCEEEKPIKVFRGRPYPPEQLIKFPPIDNTGEQGLYFDLFTKLDEMASPLPLVNLAQAPW